MNGIEVMSPRVLELIGELCALFQDSCSKPYEPGCFGPGLWCSGLFDTNGAPVPHRHVEGTVTSQQQLAQMTSAVILQWIERVKLLIECSESTEGFNPK